MTKKKSGNSLQAILDRASSPDAAAPAAAPAAEEGEGPKPGPKRRGRAAAARASNRSTVTPARAGTKMIGGHFPPEVSTRLRLLAVEEDTTVQALLEEAINDLLTKKAGRKAR